MGELISFRKKGSSDPVKRFRTRKSYPFTDNFTGVKGYRIPVEIKDGMVRLLDGAVCPLLFDKGSNREYVVIRKEGAIESRIYA